jgi:hypothetical protein
MAQTGFTPILLFGSTTASAVPPVGNLALNELAINTTDGKMYFKNTSGVVTLLASIVTAVANGGTGVTTSTGSGNNVLNTSPTLVTPLLGTATADNLSFTSPSSILNVPVGTTAQRPAGATGQIRYNTVFQSYEGYNASAWASLGGGATGAGGDTVFVQNSKAVTTSYAIPATQNASAVGPITVPSGVTITVPTGSRWVVL